MRQSTTSCRPPAWATSFRCRENHHPQANRKSASRETIIGPLFSLFSTTTMLPLPILRPLMAEYLA